jgi:hypothetical protein
VEGLLQVVRCTRDHGLAHQPDVRLRGKDNDREVRHAIVQPRERLDGPDQGLLDTHQHEVGLQLVSQRECLDSIPRARDDRETQLAQHLLDLCDAVAVRVDHHDLRYPRHCLFLHRRAPTRRVRLVRGAGTVAWPAYLWFDAYLVNVKMSSRVQS